ncbi:uncharacterized protein LOC129584416 isoform X2 [Paramacrobiotus metropolitanus]|uniref:uncharacterized protein LOC129584416 isoform X2 n=1 Tax=Paramacrobiotus metropolitanus TaxID=2943436 RepID=UPI0024459F7A|nr:uncharacterized protein LOC129584416 isoform X2 [Paramacrobiotus metropolitanus]
MKVIQQLNEGIQNGRNGIIPLKLQEPSQTMKTLTKSLSSENIIRAAEGETVQLRCNGSNTSTPWNGEDSPSQLWLNGRPINFTFADIVRPFGSKLARCSCHGNVSDSTILVSSEVVLSDMNPLTRSLTVDLIELTHMHAGKYECVQHNGSQFVVTQTFLVSPQLIPSQVFKPPMRNVTAKVGDVVQLACVVQFRALVGRLGKRFIWRSEDHVIYAPGITQARFIPEG